MTTRNDPTVPGNLQINSGAWDDFDDETRVQARVYLGTLGTAGANAIVHRNTPADWWGLRLILGNATCARIRETPDTGK